MGRRAAASHGAARAWGAAPPARVTARVHTLAHVDAGAPWLARGGAHAWGAPRGYVRDRLVELEALDKIGLESDPLGADEATSDPAVEEFSDGELLDAELEAARSVPEDDHSVPWEVRMRKKQLKLETKAVSLAVTRYRRLARRATETGAGANLRPGQQVLLSWYTPFTEAIRQEQKDVAERKSGVDRSIYGPYLLQLPPEKLAVITMHEVLGLMLRDPKGIKFTKACVTVSSAVQAEVNLMKLKKNPKVWKQFLYGGKTNSVVRVNLHAKRALKESDDGGNWSSKLHLKLGSCLIQLLLQNTAIEVEGAGEVSAFEHTYTVASRTKKIGMLNANERVLELINDGHAVREALHPRFLPMLVEPRPWTAYDQGGYLSLPNLVMRTKGSKAQVNAMREADAEGRMQQVYDGLNALAACRWKINRPVFQVALEAWNAGGGVGDLPLKVDPAAPVPPAEDMEQLSDEERLNWRRTISKYNRDNQNRHSLRCDLMYKFQVAKEFAPLEFYFPYNLDFRGRVYPIPPHLNHLGADLSRGILRFSEAKPLGERGLWWMKVHLANLWGMDKMSLDERVEFVDSQMDDIFHSARDPLGEGKWWLNADEPWQCLATCMELNNAYASEDPAAFMSSLPVHQDGSCNGLQHYAALGRDVLGAEQVNLLPNEKPQDVYIGVATRVARKVMLDAEAGNELAQVLTGKVSRKVVKQSVMTSVYGVTFVGARQQIQNRLREDESIPEEYVPKAAWYLAKLTLGSIGELFSGARLIMAWLADVAKLIAFHGHPVSWHTPLGLPVIQPYRRTGRYRIQTLLQSVLIMDTSDKLPVSSGRQKSAFPPNYIHSLDSTHMLMTGIKCREQDITFAAVHDSYWTHGADVDTMNAILRQEFVDLHSQPLLEELRDYFVETYPDITFPPLPPRGDLDLDEVKKSDYFFD